LTLACNALTGSDDGDESAAPIPESTAERPATVPTISNETISVDGPAYYVGQTGCNDGGSGGEKTPFCSFETAISHLRPGDALIIKAGTYTSRLVVNGLAGTAEAPIVIRGESRQTVFFDGGCPEFPCGINDVEWDGDEETGMVTIQDSDHVTLGDFSVQNSIAAGLNVVGGDGITVQNVTVNGTGNAGMLFQHTSNLSVLKNDIGWIQQGWRDEGDDPQIGAHESLSVVAVTGFVVADNYVHDSLKEGIDVKESSTGGEVRDNYVERSCSVSLYINEAHDVRVYRNRVRHSGYYLVDGREELCASYPIYGRMLGRFYGGGILLAVGDLGDLSQGRLSNIRLYNNVVWDIYGNGLEFWDELRDSHSGQGEMTGNWVYNNVFYNTTLAGVRLMDVSGTQVLNNVIAFNDEEAITGNAIGDNNISHNLFLFRHQGQQPFGSDFVVGDPLFVDPAGGDFHLQAGSPAIDQGMDVGLPAVGLPDIGAFEYGN
jgi:hypothetical protein